MRKIFSTGSFVAILPAGGMWQKSDGPVLAMPRTERSLQFATLGAPRKAASLPITMNQRGNDKAPYTAGTATRAETRVPGMTAEEYIRESFVTPDAYVVETYNAGDMYQEWAKDLSEQQQADLIAYLLTEK
jgi:hypothetical protein